MTKRKPYTPPAVRYSIRPESAGNGTIHDLKGEAVAYLDEWTLFVDGKRIGDVDNYRDAIIRTEQVLTGSVR
jgi:hypothetical protein